MKRSVLILLLTLACVPLRAQEETLSLQECLSAASERSPLLRNTSLDVSAARAQRDEARLEYLPKVGLTSFGFYAHHPLLEITLHDVLGHSDAAHDLNTELDALARERGIDPSYSTLKWGYGAAATLLQPVYAGGRIRSGNRLADLGLEAAVLKDSLRQREVRDSVESKYWRIVSLQIKRETLSETLALLDTLDKDLRSALLAGLATEPQQLELTLKRQKLLSGIRRLDGSLSLLKMDLLETAGLGTRPVSAGRPRLTDTLSDTPEPRSVLSGERSVAGTDEARLLQLQVEARKQEKAMAVGALLPEVAVGAGYGYSALRGAGSGSFNGMVFGTLRIPLTDIPKAVIRARRYDYQIQKALSDQDWLTSRLALREQMLALELQSSWDDMQDAIAAVQVAEDALRRIRIRYEAGSVPAAEVMQCALVLSSAKESLVERRIAYRLAVNHYRQCIQHQRD